MRALEENVNWVRRPGTGGTAGLQTGIAARQRGETTRHRAPQWQGAPPLFLTRGSPDLDYLAGVWEAAVRQFPRVKRASMKALNAGLYEVSAPPQLHPACASGVAAVRAGERFSSGHRWQLAPAVGRATWKVLADGQSTTLDISAFSVRRLGDGVRKSGRKRHLSSGDRAG